MCNMAEGGDRGKGPNKTGTQPKGRIKASPTKPGNQAVKSGAGRSAAKSKHAATKASGAATHETRKAGPKKIAARTTSKSGDKGGGAKKHTAKQASTKERKARSS
ncbi:MAG: hypothetical protein ACJ74G_19510 [Blastocatellia bacterium]